MENFRSKFFKLLTHIYQRELQIIKEFNITLLEYYALQILSFSKTTTPKEIAEKLSLPKSTVTNVIDSLEKQGILKRSIGKKDRRSFLITLTKKGEKTLEEILSKKSQLFFPLFNNLPMEEKIQLDKFLSVLTEKFDKEG